MSLFQSEYILKIPFHDLDPMNVVWHGNYIKYLEEARCDMFEKIGYTYYDMKEDDYTYPVAKLNTKFIRPLSYNQEIIIKTSLEEIQPAIIIKYCIYDKNTNSKVFEGETTQIGIFISNRETIYNPPQKLKNLLGADDEN